MSSVRIVSPHLDDAVLSAWLVLRAHPGASVITCFAGTPSQPIDGAWDARTGVGGPAPAMARRQAEDVEALTREGARAVHLPLLDEQYRGADDEPLELLELLVTLLRRELAGGDQIWLPAGVGAHADHLLVAAAGRLAVRTGQEVRVYADLPYAAQPGWPLRSPVTHGTG